MRPKNQSLVLLAALSIVIGAPAGVLAQAPGAVAKSNSTIPEKQHLGPVTPPDNGVVTPKRDTDPAMSKTPPPQSPAETPVIPPSATPGGNDAK